MKQNFFLALLLLWGFPLFAQPVNLLINGSFEDTPRQGKAPKGWMNCGSSDKETPPDVHPGDPLAPFFEVTMPSKEGKTYLGMVVRDNDTWEAVGQRLSTPLEAGQTYRLSAYLAQSPDYVSQSRTTFREVDYTQPVLLRVWGADSSCGRAELLASSPAIDRDHWQHFEMEFVPKAPYTHLVLEAYSLPSDWGVNGHILVDAVVLTKQ